jgi:hypothetical protein
LCPCNICFTKSDGIRISCNSVSHLIIAKIHQKLDVLLFYLAKLFLKTFRCYVKIWCNFPNVAILMFLAFLQMDGF